MLRLTLSIALLLGVSACYKPEVPPTEQKPEPQTQQHTELRDAIQQPIDKAKNVEAQVLEAAKQQQDEIDAATGN